MRFKQLERLGLISMKALVKLAEIVVWVKGITKCDRSLNEVFERAGPRQLRTTLQHFFKSRF